jgi:hypothetical protein
MMKKEENMDILYSDKTIISRNDCGFIFSFLTNAIEGVRSDEVVAQVAMSPQFAKRFLVHLYTNIGDFEKEFGEIKMSPVTITDLKSGKAPLGFR